MLRLRMALNPMHARECRRPGHESQLGNPSQDGARVLLALGLTACLVESLITA